MSCSAVATRHKFYEAVVDDLRNHRYDQAAARITKDRYSEKDRLLYFLDAGLTRHYAGNCDTSNLNLTEAEYAAEDLFTKSISRAAATLFLNDNILEYAGEDYEVLYANLIKALNYVSLGKFDDAFVEIRRANEKLDLLELKYADAAARYRETPPDDTTDVNARIDYNVEKVRFNNDAFARYLSMHIYAVEGKMDDARIDHDLLVDAFRNQPHIYDFDIPDVHYYAADTGKTIVSFVALAGLAPVKEALNLRIRTDKQLNLVQVLYTDGANKDTEYGHIFFPVKADYYFKFAIPKMAPRTSAIGQIRVLSGSEVFGQLQLIEDVSRVAEETFKAKRSLIYLRTIARAIAKGYATHKVKENLDEKTGGGVGGWLAKAAVDVGTDISENADLRCSRTLPGKIYVADFELAPGTYDFTVEFLDRSGHTLYTQEISGYRVRQGSLNMIEAIALN